MSYGNQVKRTLIHRQRQSLLKGLVLESSYRHSTQPKCYGFQKQVLRGVSHFHVEITRSPRGTVLAGCTLIYRGNHEHRRSLGDSLLVQRGAAHGRSQVAVGKPGKLMGACFVMIEPAGRGDINLKGIKRSCGRSRPQAVPRQNAIVMLSLQKKPPRDRSLGQSLGAWLSLK